MSGKNPIARLGDPPPQADEFKVYTVKSYVKFLLRGVQPPSAVYVDPNDVLQVGCASNQSSEVVTVSYRLLRADGELILGQFQLFPLAFRAIVTKQEPLAEGFLLSVSCKAAVATTRGQTFVRVFLTDSSLGAGQPSYMLMADYVTTAMAPAHPNGRVLAPSEGPGWYHTAFGFTNIGVATASASVPLNARFRIQAGNFVGQTDAVVGNRTAQLSIIVGGTIGWSVVCPTFQTASQVITYYYGGVQVRDTINLAIGNLALPLNMTLLANDQIQVRLANPDAGDTIASAGVAIEEWLDNV